MDNSCRTVFTGVTTFTSKRILDYLVSYDWPSDPEKSGPFDSAGYADWSDLVSTLVRNAVFVLHMQAIGSTTLLNYYAGASSCTLKTPTHQKSHVKIRQHSCKIIYDIVAANGNDFAFTSTTGYCIKSSYITSKLSKPHDASCSMNFLVWEIGMKSSYTVSNCVCLSSLIAESISAGNETQSFDGKHM